jgi:hypothetical protein
MILSNTFIGFIPLTPYKRSIFLINPPFQLKFSLIASSMIFISTLIYPVIIIDFFSFISKKLPRLAGEISAVQSDLIIYLVVIQLVLTMLVFLTFIFFTHKIAGPLYKLRNHLDSIRQGKPLTPLTFRKGDYFQEIADEVSLFLESIQEKHEMDFGQIEDVVQYLENIATVIPDDKKAVMSEISRQLMEIRNRYKTPHNQ